MLTVSLTMIVRNEEATLSRVLAQAVRVCEEIIVVDTGSTDRTIAIAEQYGAKVFHFEWVDDFSLARNYALDQASGDLILWLDADDVIPDVTLIGIHNLKHIMAKPEHATVEAVMMPYRYTFDTAGQPAFIIRNARMFRRDPSLRWEYAVHEHVPVSTTLTVEDIWIEHRPSEGLEVSKSERNIRILEQAIAGGESRSPMMLTYAQHLESRGDYAQAVELYTLLIDRNESQHFVYESLLGLTRTSVRSGEDARVIEHAQRAINVAPQRVEAYLEMARYHMLRENYESAIPLLDAVLRLPADHSALYTLSHNMRAYPLTLLSECYLSLGKISVAIEFKQASIPIHPDPAGAQQELDDLLRLAATLPPHDTPIGPPHRSR